MTNNELTIKNRLCFSFCQDLGNKAIYETNLDKQLNITWSLFRIRQFAKMPRRTTGVIIDGTDFAIPGYYQVEKLGSNGFYSMMDDLNSRNYTVFMAPNDYCKDGNLFYSFDRIIKVTTPTKMKNFPHMHKHSTFQLFYLRDELFTCSCQFLSCDEDGDFVIQILVRVSPTGTFLYLASKTAFLKWKIAITQGIININFLGEAKKIVDDINEKIKNAASHVVPIVGPALRELLKKTTKESDDGGVLAKLGLDSEKNRRKFDKQTAMLFQKQLPTSDFLTEPSIFYANSLAFSYNLFEYYLRAFSPFFQARIYSSDNLYENLKHNNNENPITYPLNITFNELYKITKKGYYQGDLRLDYDPGGYLAKKFKEGITFFEDKNKDFITPNLDVSAIEEKIIRNSVNDEFCVSEEIREKTIAVVDRVKKNNYHQRAHFFIHYEDGQNEHWLVKFPKSFTDQDLAEGHNKGAFNLYFDKPVKSFHDVYTCIGCGALNQGYTVLHSNYDSDVNDSLEIVNKGLPYDPWFIEFTTATLRRGKWFCPNGKCLGAEYDVWDQAEEKKPDGKSFSAAYGFIPNGNTIRWRLGSTGIKIQEIPQQNDFSGLDWQPPTGGMEDIRPTTTAFSFGESDIPDSPDIPESEPDFRDLETGEPETIIEPDITIEPDAPEDEPDFPEPDIPEPEFTPDIPEPDPTDPDATPDTGDDDVPSDDIPDSGDAD